MKKIKENRNHDGIMKKVSNIKEEPSISKKLTPLQKKMQQKLLGGKFRWINEQLYKNPSDESFQMFQKDESLFFTYHEGFRSQVKSWPANPVDLFIKQLRNIKKRKIIADMGCGEAKIAAECKNHEVHSFDLVAANELVTVADISNVPLKDSSMDVVIFCLSLMGTNYIDFIKESNRILKIGGELKIAEVNSRLENVVDFIKSLEACGFTVKLKVVRF